MDRTERFYRIDILIRSRGCISFADLQDELEVSPATLKRDLQYLRDRMDAPIVYDRDANGYRFGADPSLPGRAPATRLALPGVWFSEPELHALLTMHQLIAGLDEGGVLARHLQPLLDKVQGMLGADGVELQALLRRIRIASPAQRPVTSRWFEAAGSALLGRKRLDLHYWSRVRREVSQRTVSPQRLMHYRNTWYLDAWCHQTNALRRFALDAVREAHVTADKAKDVPLARVEAELDQGYGVFGGDKLQWAVLDFDADAAQWVQHEQWHPEQEQKLLADGGLRLRVPFTSPTELVMDLLRHGPHVRVVSPASLVREVQGRLQAALQRYQPGNAASADGEGFAA